MDFKRAYSCSNYKDELVKNCVTYRIRSSIPVFDSNPKEYCVEKVAPTFSELLKVQLMANQTERALQSNAFPLYNKDCRWISIPTICHSRKVDITKPLPK